MPSVHRMYAAFGWANLNVAWPKFVNGIIIVTTNAIAESAIIIADGFLEKRKNFFVRMENKNTSSVSMLPINQLVCKASGEILTNMAKKIKSNVVLTSPNTVAKKAISRKLYFCGSLISFSSILSVATAIIGKSDNKFTKRICRGSIGKKSIIKEAMATA